MSSLCSSSTSFGLIPYLTATENVGMPLRISHEDPGPRDERVSRVLEFVGLAASQDSYTAHVTITSAGCAK